jgi:demethylmenaquinone methyltransferase/2-methoxy-6-polyprenyl-1,4-benzoquinol methylase
MNTDMVDYYRRRAAIYERVYRRPHRQADLRAMEAWIAQPFAGRDVLEIACGTGWWTPHAARDCRHWLATDLNPETMTIARAKPLPPGRVDFEIADAYDLSALGGRVFDAAFAGCWWSHVPLQKLSAWVDGLHARLVPGARVVVLDNRYVEGDSALITRHDEFGNGYQTRELDDGSLHEVLKNFPDAQSMRALLGARAAGFEWRQWPHYWAASWTTPGIAA